jgi:phage terminase Nu1 subunit (DNA packaging protein)
VDVVEELLHVAPIHHGRRRGEDRRSQSKAVSSRVATLPHGEGEGEGEGGGGERASSGARSRLTLEREVLTALKDERARVIRVITNK